MSYCLLCENLSSSIHGQTASVLRHDYFMTTRYFVPYYFQLMFTEMLLCETDETACYMFLNAPRKSFYVNLLFEQLFVTF